MDAGFAWSSPVKEVNGRNERHKGVVREIGSGRVELVNSLLLHLDVHLFDFELGHGVNLLNVEVRRYSKLVLLVVLLRLLYVKRAVHDLDLDLEAS